MKKLFFINIEKWKNKPFYKTTKKRKSIFFASVISSISLLVFSYIYGNISLPMSGTEIFALKGAEQMKAWWNGNGSSAWNDSVLLINTSFDFDTIPFYEYTQDTTRYAVHDGYYTATSRKDLFRVLAAFNRDTTSYRYIILDIALDSLPRNHSKYVDSLAMYTDSLVDLIVSMPRICIAQSKTFDLVSTRLKEKSGMVDYYETSSVSEFVKFRLVEDTTLSLPLKMYKDLTGRTIKTNLWGLLFTERGHLCHQCIIPMFPFLYRESTYGWDIIDKGDYHDTIYYKMDNHYNLHQFREWYADYDNVKEMANNKIVVIGDLFTHDKHTTYAGQMSGAVILFNTYINLSQGHHYVHWWLVSFLLFFYIGVFYFMICGEKLWFKIPFCQRFWQADVVQLIISFLSWTLIFHALAMFLYSLGLSYNVWLPIIWFTLVSKLYKILILPKYE